MGRLTIIFSLVACFTWSQVPRDFVFYRGIENKLPLSLLGDSLVLDVFDTELQAQVQNDSLCVTLPSLYSYNSIKIGMRSETKVMRDTLEIPVVYLPNPQIEFHTTNCYSCKGQTMIRCFTRTYLKQQIEFEVLNYSLEYNGRVARGRGKYLTADSMALIKQMNLGDSYMITGEVRGPDGMIRQVQGKFILE